MKRKILCPVCKTLVIVKYRRVEGSYSSGATDLISCSECGIVMDLVTARGITDKMDEILKET